MYNGFSETKTNFLITINLPNKNKSHPLKLDKSHRGGEDRIIDKKKGELVVNASDSARRHSDKDTVTPSRHVMATKSDHPNQISNHLICGETKNLPRS